MFGPDLHKLITLRDSVLSKAEAVAVLPERVRIHLKEERALLVNLLESPGRETGTEPQPC
jgi:hypothetical protein